MVGFNRFSMSKTVVIFLGFIFLVFSFKAKSQEYYWVAFTDKNQTSFSLNEPEKYLSERAIQRRIRQNIPIDSLDLPVNQTYVQQIIGMGAELVHTSKWLNGITVKSETDSFSFKLLQLPFIKEIQLTKPDSVGTKSAFSKFIETYSSETVFEGDTEYGISQGQIDIMNGRLLHNLNYRGQGMQIAVLDAGYYSVDTYPAFDSLWTNNQILGTRDFVNPNSIIFDTHFHGMSVLSCMGGNIPGELIGTAPKAGYWLLRSEDNDTEYIIEEDNWVAAAEFADSVGCDIINTSLGYNEFYDSSTDHTYDDMDGKTTRVTRGANIAFSKGMLVFSSAGNEGNKTWKYITAPADGDNVIAVGAVNTDTIPAYFSSFGPSVDGDIKPNIAAVGYNTYVERSTGVLGYYNGTSFSSPVMAGMAACLWQVNPGASAATVKEIIEMSAHNYSNPDSVMGYGIPDMSKALQLMTDLMSISEKPEAKWLAYPNPVSETLFLLTDNTISDRTFKISIYTLDGKLLRQWIKPSAQRIELQNLNSLPAGILLLKVENRGNVETIKLSKL